MAKIRLTLTSKNESVYTPGQVQLQFATVIKADPNSATVSPVTAPQPSANVTASTSDASGLVVGQDYDLTFTPAT